MGHYSIKDLEKLSGVKAHTIRIWEKRYGVIKPTRTDTNIRVYCDTELKKLLNVAALNNHGLKISKIAQLNHEDLCEELNKIAPVDKANCTHIDELVVAMVELDRSKFEKVLADCTLKMGFEETCIQVLYPFLQKIGVMWQTDACSAAHEHFVSSLIIQKLYVAIDQAYQPKLSKPKKALLYLPEGELHEMGLLFYRYLMKKRGYETVYLGQSVPYADLIKIVEALNPDYIVTAFVSSISCDALQAYLTDVSVAFKSKKIIASGHQVCSFERSVPKNVATVSCAKGFVELIEAA